MLGSGFLETNIVSGFLICFYLGDHRRTRMATECDKPLYTYARYAFVTDGTYRPKGPGSGSGSGILVFSLRGHDLCSL